MKKYIFSVVMLLSMTLLTNRVINSECPFVAKETSEASEEAKEMPKKESMSGEESMPMNEEESFLDVDEDEDGNQEEVEVEEEETEK